VADGPREENLFFYWQILTNLDKFKALGISEKTLEKLAQKWFEEPSPIQEKIIPLLLAWDQNIIGQAQTGTGKTAAFGIPLVERITKHSKHTQALILTPTRELAIQVAEEIHSFVSDRSIKVLPIYGGQSYNLQIKNLRAWIDIVVGTPGRIIDHLENKKLDISKLSYLILDEADEMLNMGFIDDINKILSYANDDKAMMLFSATMPKEILQVAKRYMPDYQLVAVKKEQRTTTQTDQIYFEVNQQDKLEALTRIMDLEHDFYGIVFCKTKLDVDSVASRLSQRGYNAEAIHGDIEQRQREKILQRFKKKYTTALIATDVAARGIDVNDVTHVINYSLPGDPEAYIHRVGRTGRAGKKWTAITFVTPSEYKKIVFFKRATKTDIKLGTIPNIQQIIKAKKDKFQQDLQTIIEEEKYSKHLDLAQELLSQGDADTIVASLLTLTMDKTFSVDKYREISKVSIDKTGKSRLFIAVGKKDGYSARTLVDYVSEVSEVQGRYIDDVRVMEEFSFITVGFADAELILHAFEKTRKKGQRPLVSKAKDKARSSGTRRASGNRNGRRSWGSRSHSSPRRR